STPPTPCVWTVPVFSTATNGDATAPHHARPNRPLRPVVQVAGCMNVYERFTDRARGVVILADLACRELGQTEVGTEHLLIGVTEEVGTAHHVLRAMGVTPERVRSATEEIFGATDATPEGKLEY